MNLGIAVIAANRPKYLYVTLDGVFRTKGIDKYDVSVYFEPSANEVKPEFYSLLSDFPVYSLTFHKHKLGLLYQILYAFDDIFKRGHDEALFLADDHLILSSSLEYLESLPRKAFFYVLRKYTHELDVPYAIGAGMGGMLLSKESFYWLKQLIDAKTYRGLDWHGYDMPIYESEKDGFIPEIMAVDGIVDGIAHLYQLVRSIPPISYLAHFGVRRLYMDDSYKEQIERIEAEFFAGTKHDWLNNIANILRKGEYQAELDSGLFPRYFDYK